MAAPIPREPPVTMMRPEGMARSSAEKCSGDFEGEAGVGQFTGVLRLTA